MLVKPLGRVNYQDTYQAMQDFTAGRKPDTEDEIWLCQHPPVFTQGLAGLAGHVLNAGDIPVIPTNRGGQVTYHGPGQVMAYPMVNLQRAGYFVKEYVYRLEEAVIKTLSHFGITGHRVANAPGIYVRLADPFAHTALTGPAAPSDPFKGLGKIRVAAHPLTDGVCFLVFRCHSRLDGIARLDTFQDCFLYCL